jgi:hypothetical protein
VTIWKTHLLDLDLVLRELVLAEDDGEGDAVGFGGLELVLQLWLYLVEELRLGGNLLVDVYKGASTAAEFRTLMPASHSFEAISILSFSRPFQVGPPPNAMTNTSTSFLRTAAAFLSASIRALVIEKILSTPNEIPTHGI